MPIDDAATRTLRAAGIGLGPRDDAATRSLRAAGIGLGPRDDAATRTLRAAGIGLGPRDDAATRTLRAAGIGLGPRNERLATAAGRHPAREVGSYRLGFSPSMRPVSIPRPANDPEHRFCARPTCSRHSVATMSYNQASRVVFLGPLSAERDPSLYDLCRFHVDRLTPPTGWTVDRARPSVVGEVEGDGASTLGSWSTTLHGMSAELTSAR